MKFNIVVPAMGIAAPLHPCSRGIQYILYIKKPPEKGAYM
jgi:hypothetical protein